MRPVISRNSRTLSNTPESEQSGSAIGNSFFRSSPNNGARDDALARAHPVLVAAQRVDLAVVRHETVRLRAVPARERVRREARMHHRQMRRVVGRAQVRIEVQQLTRRQHALVDEHLRRQAADVELLRLLQASCRRAAGGSRACASDTACARTRRLRSRRRRRRIAARCAARRRARRRPRSAASASVGTTRQPTSTWPSSAQSAATVALQRSRSAGVGRQEHDAGGELAGRRQRHAERSPSRLAPETRGAAP